MWELLLLILGAGALAAAKRGQAYEAQPIANRVIRYRSSDGACMVRYLTRDGTCDYGFSIERQPDGDYRSYVLSQPDYARRPTDAQSTHRHSDDNGRQYVCWSQPLRSRDEALHVSALWAEATQDYIKYGRRF